MARVFIISGLLLSGAGVAACLYLSLGLKLIVCPLCIYQRTFIMAVFAVLVAGLLAARKQPGVVSALCVPLAFAGLGVAGFHEYLLLNGTLECPLGLLDIGTLPAQSLALFSLLSVTSVGGVWAARAEFAMPRPVVVILTILLGLLLAWGSVASAPPVPARTKPYDAVKEPFNNCRPVFVPAHEHK